LKRVALVLAGLIVLLSPFGEGGRRPDVLAALHLATLLLILLAGWRLLAASDGGRPHGRGVGILLLPAAFLALALLAALRAGYAYAALLGVMDLLAAVGAVVSAAFLLGESGDLLRLRNMVVASTALQAAVVLRTLLASGMESAGRAFLNRNHLAAFLGVGLALSSAAAEAAARRGARRAAWGWTLLAAVHLAAMLPLQSRGAALGLAAAAGALLFVRWRSWSRRARVLALCGCAAALGGCVIFLALRFAAGGDPDRYTRVRIWAAACAMWGEDPLLGLGPGMFPHEAVRHNFPMDRDPVRYGRQFQGGHSAILTTAAETGLPAVFLLLAAALAWIRALLRRPAAAAQESDHTGAVFGVGLALLALLAQALVEDLQERPAIVLTAALLAGAAIAAARRWRIRGPAAAPAARPLTAAALGVLVLWIAAGGVIGPWLGWRSATRARAAGREGLPLMERAARLDPWNAEYHADLAMATLNSGPPDPARYARAAIELDRARRCHPRDARLVLYRARLEARAGAVILSDASAGTRASALYEEAAALAPTDPRPRLEHAGQLVDAGQLEAALAATRGALAIEPNYRRARLLQIDLLERMRRPELPAAFEALAATDAALTAYAPDSGYASEIAGDDRALRSRIEGARPAAGAPLASASSR
jgi:O-antigen ligase